MREAALPITLIVVGIVWLLWYRELLPDRDWIIAIGFMAAGLIVLALDGLTKNSVVMGPFLVAIGGAWIFHDRYHTSFAEIIPAMLVVLGVLMLVARSPSIPQRRARDTPRS